MTPITRDDLPNYRDLIYPTLVAVDQLGGSAQAREITAEVLSAIGATDAQLELSYDTRPKSVLIDRLDWARSYSALGGLLDRPRRGLFLMTALGKETLALPEQEARDRIADIDREVRAARRKQPKASADPESGEPTEEDEAIDAEGEDWRDALLARLHRLTPDSFEEFVIYLLKSYGMQLTRVGGSGDEGIDGIGEAPISPVLFSRVAVQAKRYDPTRTVGREAVALFQRDAAAAGAELAVLVTLGRFSAAARKASISATPTVNLIDGDRLCDLSNEQGIALRSVLVVDEDWLARYDSVPEGETDHAILGDEV